MNIIAIHDSHFANISLIYRSENKTIGFISLDNDHDGRVHADHIKESNPNTPIIKGSNIFDILQSLASGDSIEDIMNNHNR